MYSCFAFLFVVLLSGCLGGLVPLQTPLKFVAVQATYESYLVFENF